MYLYFLYFNQLQPSLWRIFRCSIQMKKMPSFLMLISQFSKHLERNRRQPARCHSCPQSQVRSTSAQRSARGESSERSIAFQAHVFRVGATSQWRRRHVPRRTQVRIILLVDFFLLQVQVVNEIFVGICTACCLIGRSISESSFNLRSYWLERN